jgi:hypothetical protein
MSKKKATKAGTQQIKKVSTAGPRVRCTKCKDIIQSMYRHDFVWCKCARIAVDGGSDYLKLTFTAPDDYEVIDDEKPNRKRPGKHPKRN